MDILLRQILVTDPSSPFYQQQADIFIQNGIIAEMGSINRSVDKEVSVKDLCVSTGWTDIFSNFCDPGFEFKETLESGAKTAASGGYTDVFVLPNTAPVIHNKSGVEYIVQRSKSLPVYIHPIAAITKNTEGKELAEMYDMYNSGAVAFSDGTASVQSSGLLLKALQYIKAINKIIIQVPDDRSIRASGLINEGIISTRLGLPGMPAIAEELMISRDIELAAYTSSRIHFTGISTATSVQLIKAAKDKGINVTCSITPYHLFYSDEDLVQYDTNLKLNPPLRTKTDQRALKAAITDGTIDCVATHHMPQEKDHKIVEFEYANFGMTGLETSFALLRTSMPELPIEKIISLLSISPRKIFDLPLHKITTGQPASLTLFNPNEPWVYEHTYSKSLNSPLFGKQLTGRPLGIINKDNLFLNQ